MGKTIRFNENSLIAIKNKLNEIMAGSDDIVSHNDVSAVKLYHGTTIDALLMIMESGVMSAKRGKQHGETYGVNWFSLKNGDNFNKGVLFSIEVPGDAFNERFRMMNNSEAISKDDDLDITGFNLTIEKICGLSREAIKNAYDRNVSKGERYPLESTGYLFYHFIERVQDDDVLFPSILYHNWDKYYPMIMKNILGDSINESVAKEFAPVAKIGAEPNSPAGGTFHHMEQEQTDEDSLTEGIKFDQHGLSFNDDKILKKYNLKDLILSKTGNYVTLNKIIANELGKGNGSRFMEELTKIADDNGWILALTPDTSFGGSSVGRLKKFYKRFGFVPNRGRGTDFNTRESMIRRPEKNKNVIIPENKLGIIKENIESEVESSEVDLSSFKKRDTLPPGIWKDEETLNSKVRLKLLDIADDFWKFVNLTWVEPKGIIITGSICNFNWSKFSDIDLHLVVDFNEIDSKTEFVKQYLDSKKNEWNAEHEGLKIMGFPVELYTQDVSDNVEAGGIYDLEENVWIRRPNPHTIKSIGLEKFDIKRKAAEIMTIIDEMYKTLSSTDDGYEVSKIGEDASYLWEKVKSLRKKSLTKHGENGAGNIVYKVLRRTGYLDKLFKLFSTTYDKSNSITESTKQYLKVLKEEFAMDGSSEGNPYEKRWKAERDALKNFVANYGKLMQSKEDNKMGRLYKVYYDETMSNLIGYNYCICVQWDEMTMKPKSTVYIRALDKFTPFIRRNLQFDNRGMDNQRGTYDDNRFVRESVDELNLYHSSYSNFDKFNHRKYLSSGAGSQTFGWGTYLTDSFPIAESYAGKFIWQKFNEFVTSAEPEDYIGDDSQYNYEIVKEACRLYRSIVRTRIVFTYGIEYKYSRNFFDCEFEVSGDPAEEYDNMMKKYEEFKELLRTRLEKQAVKVTPPSDEQMKNAFSIMNSGGEILNTPRDEYIATTTRNNSINSLVKLIINNIWDAADNHVKKESYIYEVEIPDDNGYNYLDYSNPVSPETAKLISSGVMKLYRRFGNKINTNRLDNAVEECLNGRMRGKKLYEELTSALGGSEKAASLFLNQCGIVGIKYRAGTIYGLPDGANENSLNYVIFDANNVRITSKNLFTDNF